MIQAIVFLPLIGAVLAGLIAVFGAHARNPSGDVVEHHDDAHGADAHASDAHDDHADDHGHDDHHVAEPPAAGSRAAELITTGLLLVSAALSWAALIDVGFMHHDVRIALFPWITSGDLQVSWSLRVDTLTAVMLVVVNTVSSLVHLYSIGYMDEDPYRPRFFAYLSLFTFAMLMLVTSDNLVQLFFGWEGVGLASYLLIGFWYQKPSANAAAIKAFVVNRVGDFGFRARHFRDLHADRLDRLRDDLCRRAGPDRQNHRFLRMARRRADADLPLAVHGGNGQVGAVPAAHLVAGRHGRPDAGLGPDSRGDHGHRGGLHGGAVIAFV